MALRSIQATYMYICTWWLALPFPDGAALYAGYLYLYLHLVACLYPSRMALRSIQATYIYLHLVACLCPSRMALCSIQAIYIYICTWWLAFALPGWRFALSRLLLCLVKLMSYSRMALRSILVRCVLSSEA